MPSFFNPIFNKDTANCDDGLTEKEYEEKTRITTEDLLEIDKILEDIVIKKCHDLSNLSGKRQTGGRDGKPDNQTGNQIQIGSLEIAETKRTNDDELSKEEEATKLFMEYFVNLGHIDNRDEFNFEHVENLCKNADVNKRDIHGQSVMHEVVRSLSTDVALFLKIKGVDIDASDNWRRTPLMVAVASNYVIMVKWLLQNGADINHRTKKDGLTAIHIAAKYEALETFDLLIEFGASPLERDFQRKTPFHHAAELGDARMCRYLLDLELPVASFDANGVSILDHLINNCHSDIYKRALNQYISSPSKSSVDFHVHLNCLTRSRWKMLIRRKNEMIPKFRPPAILDIITEKKEYDAVSHPVIINLIEMKRKAYGNKYLLMNIVLNLLFTLLWTVSSSIRIETVQPSHTEGNRGFILIITIFSQLLTFFFMYKLFIEWKTGRAYNRYEKARRENDVDRMPPTCHPRWPRDTANLKQRTELLEQPAPSFFGDGWVLIEVACLFLASVFTIITIMWYLRPQNAAVRMYYSAFFVLVVWIRLNRCFRYHETFGPFIEMLGECVVASGQIGFLFIEFYVPLSVAFWVLFGGDPIHGIEFEYYQINNMLYQLWLLTFIGDYDLDSLTGMSRLPAQLLVGLFLLLVSIIAFNIYIALLSAVFARIYANSLPRTYLEEAKIYVCIERVFPHVELLFEKYVNKFCSPASVSKKEILCGGSSELNPLTVIAEAVNTTRALESSMAKVIDDETAHRKDLELVDNSFRVFHDKYTADDSQKVLKNVRAMLDATNRTSTEVVVNWFQAMKMRLENQVLIYTEN